MAKHLVKCMYCNKTFDTNEEEFVKPRSNRYAHKKCAADYLSQMSKEEKDEQLLNEYIKELFGANANWLLIRKQINKYKKENNYTTSGIYKTLKYFYEVKRGDITKANGAIGIVPFVYEQAFLYWRALWEAQQNNVVKVSELVPQEPVSAIEIHIEPPKRQIMRKHKKLFAFLEGEEE